MKAWHPAERVVAVMALAVACAVVLIHFGALA